MRWPEDASGWPHAEHSRQILVRPHRWHVQEMGQGPLILLLHGAGGATQSWRGIMPILAEDFRVIAVDLPGQGFSQSGARSRLGLTAMAQDLASLATDQGWHPDALIGHSAGAALALEVARIAPWPHTPIVGINAALANFSGVAGWLFPMIARALAINPLSAALFAATARAPGRVDRLIEGTGSKIDAEGMAFYRRLIQDRAHVDATLSMMAQWSLEGLLNALESLQNPVLLLTGDNDQTVPPETSAKAVARLPNGQLESLGQLGHLAHEEAPELVVERFRAFLAKGR